MGERGTHPTWPDGEPFLIGQLVEFDRPYAPQGDSMVTRSGAITGIETFDRVRVLAEGGWTTHDPADASDLRRATAPQEPLPDQGEGQ